jgi:KaiC/GvpD/RAD55 family RecA-like ATPase
LESITSGIRALDPLLRGSLAKTTNIVVSGSTDDPYEFSLDLVSNWNSTRDICLYGTISRTREEIIWDLTSRDKEISASVVNGTLRIVDYLASAEEEPGTPEERIDTLLNMTPNALEPEKFYQVFMRELKDANSRHPGKKFLAVFDSLDTLFSAMGSEDSLRFAGMTFKVLEETNGVGVALLRAERMPEETLEIVKYAADVFIVLEKEKKEKEIYRTFRIIKPEGIPLSHNCVP